MFRSKLFRSLSLAVCLAVFMAAPAWGSMVDSHPAVDPHRVEGASLGAPVDLTQTWLLRTGDDPSYANPNFDDSQWMVVEAGKKLASYGLTNVDQVWYRTHVHIIPGQQDVSLLLRFFGGSFQIFVNGVQVGSSNTHPAGGDRERNFDQRFKIPPALLSSGDLTIAVRAEIGRRAEGGKQEGGFTSSTLLLLGPTPLLADTTLLYIFRSYASNIANIGMEILVPLIALALALTLPREREYIALAISSLAALLLDIHSVWHTVTNGQQGFLTFIAVAFLNAVQMIALLEFVRLTLGLKRTRRWVVYENMIGVVLLIAIPVILHSASAGASGPNFFKPTSAFIVAASLIQQIFLLPITAGMPLLALWVWRTRRNPDALLLFVPLFLEAVVQYSQYALFLLNRLHLTERSMLPVFPVQTLFIPWSEIAAFFFNVALLLFLVLRTVRIARSRAAMASDLRAVQGVQEILLARNSPATPGYRIEHVYYPASEVGGDFYLVSPAPDGSLTAIVGDVSGKGLVAAMQVSMILGVLRREEERDPEAVLRHLNDALLMHAEMGFTTACCVRLQRDGRYIVANAGHIPPYVDGKEIATPSSLPLGLEVGQTFEQISGYLAEGKTMVLMSDGVVEARSSKGELYGFDRLPKLTMMAASDIADIARRFGQEDDITVLTLTRA